MLPSLISPTEGSVAGHTLTVDTNIDKELILEEFLPYRLAILSHTVSTSIAQAYDQRFGLTIPEWRVIAILGRFPGLSAVEVAERTMMDKVAVSRAILNLSEEGRKVHDEIAPLALGIEDDLLHGLTDDQIRTLNEIIERLLARARLIGAP
jgi:DNA-binding MarR family transcriptional regulator